MCSCWSLSDLFLTDIEIKVNKAVKLHCVSCLVPHQQWEHGRITEQAYRAQASGVQGVKGPLLRKSFCLKWLLTFVVGESQSSVKSKDVLIVSAKQMQSSNCLIMAAQHAEAAVTVHWNIVKLEEQFKSESNLQFKLNTEVHLTFLNQQQHLRVLVHLQKVWVSCSCVGGVGVFSHVCTHHLIIHSRQGRMCLQYHWCIQQDIGTKPNTSRKIN